MDYKSALQKIKDWIKDLIIVQYRQSPKNRALIDLICELLFAENLILQIRDLCLNVDESIGAQLDVVGKWVGVDRVYNGTELWEHPYLSFINYTDIQDANFPNNLDSTQGGFSKYTTFADNDGGFLMYKQWMDTRTATNNVGDDIYRQLIKLKIIKNSVNHSKKVLDDAIYKWSNGKVYLTWNTMQIIYNYDVSYKSIMTVASFKDILPHPTGCEIVTQQVV